jgi:hypothetical protein
LFVKETNLTIKSDNKSDVIPSVATPSAFRAAAFTLSLKFDANR